MDNKTYLYFFYLVTAPKNQEIRLTYDLYFPFQGIFGDWLYKSKIFQKSPETGTRYKDIHSTFDRAVKRSKIPHITFHKLRHTTASRLNEMGIDIVTIQKMLDHSDIKTTMRYTHNAKSSIDNAIMALDKY